MREAHFWVFIIITRTPVRLIFPLLYVATQGKRSVWNNLFVDVDTVCCCLEVLHSLTLTVCASTSCCCCCWPSSNRHCRLFSVQSNIPPRWPENANPQIPPFPILFILLHWPCVCILLYILSSDFVICSTILGCLKWNCPAGFQLQEARWGCGMPGISPGSIGNSRHLPLGKGPDMNLLLRHATPRALFPAFAAAQEFSTVYCPCQRGTEKKAHSSKRKVLRLIYVLCMYN